MKKQYTLNDLQIRTIPCQKENDAMINYTHKVLFSRPLTEEEKQEFMKLIASIYSTSQVLDKDDSSQINVKFLKGNQQAEYTLNKNQISGDKKDMILAKLVIFSQNVVAIKQHDDNSLLSPELNKVNPLQEGAKSQIDGSVIPEVKPEIALTVLPLINEFEKLEKRMNELENLWVSTKITTTN
jgi:hypothetical protein